MLLGGIMRGQSSTLPAAVFDERQTGQPEPALPFAQPDLGQEEIDRVSRCLRSGWLTSGPECQEFEARFSELLQGSHCLAVNSATAAFALLFHALKIGQGDEVISSCWTFSSPVMEIWKTGAKPVLVDVNRPTLNMDPDAVEAAITPRTKGIVVTHFAGLPCDMRAILGLARKHGLWIVEDASHALPAYHNGHLIGTLNTLATVFSFYATKTMTTGEGGMLVTRDDEIARSARVSRLHGIDRDTFSRLSQTSPNWRYEIVDVGFKANMTDVAAAIGIAQMEKLSAFADKRLQLARRYHVRLRDAPIELPVMEEGEGRSAAHLYVVRPKAVSRDRFIQHLWSRGIGTSVHFIPLTLHSFWQTQLGVAPSTCPIALEEFQRVASLPLYSKMTLHDADRVIEAILELN
jgi:dTDP-4-amino-4,6-dideoxygalactose transaminase